MKLGTRARYACRALAAVARAEAAGRSVRVKEVALEQGIPFDYLVQIIQTLKAGGLVETKRGVGGGLTLRRAPSEITVADVVSLMEGSITPAQCVDHPERCGRRASCAVREVWVDLGKAIRGALEGYTVADLARKTEEMERAEGPMYFI